MLRERGACALPAPLTKPSDWLSWELLRRQRPLAARPAAAQGRGSLRRRLGAGPGPRRLHRPGQASPGFPLVPRLHSDVLTTMVHPVHLEMFTFTGKEVDPSDSKDCFQELAVLRNPVICILCRAFLRQNLKEGQVTERRKSENPPGLTTESPAALLEWQARAGSCH
ncbi:uncharacterized protein ACIBXB_002067 isoform 1-T1 [Morphnus guianensis]